MSIAILSSAPVRVAIASAVSIFVVPAAIRTLDFVVPELSKVDAARNAIETAGLTGAVVAMGYVLLTMAAQGWG